MRMGRWLLAAVAWVGLAACQVGSARVGEAVLGTSLASGAQHPAQVLGPDLPQDWLEAQLSGLQAAADEASKKREIDFFRLQRQGVALRWRLPSGEAVGVMGLVGCSRERTEVAIEATALLAGEVPAASIFSYGGPVAWQGLGDKALGQPGARRSQGRLGWSLMQGLPPSEVLAPYARRMEALASGLQRHYGARPFTWDEVPLCFVLEQGEGAALAFVLANHRNRLVLGERKAADVRQLMAFGPQGQLLGSATLLGWDPKLPDPQAEAAFQRAVGPQGEAIFSWGEAP